MSKKREINQHYYSQFPDAKFKLNTISESLRKHLYIFKTLPGIFSFKKIDLGTKILIENMTIPKDPSILLDLGCGYGVIGIVLGYETPRSTIFLIDINKRAIWCAKENVRLNLPDIIKQFKILSGNYFDPIVGRNLKFDGIYMNPPLRQGRKELIDLCLKVPNYLKPNGFFQFVIRRKMGAAYILNHLKKHHHYNGVQVVCKRSGYWVFNYVFD
jgi:16S rRNA G1207 methylase RsmC